MKKGWIIALCVLLVLGAGAGFAYYRLYSTAQDAEQMQRTIFEQYEAMLQNAEQTTLTVTENGETVERGYSSLGELRQTEHLILLRSGKQQWFFLARDGIEGGTEAEFLAFLRQVLPAE